jgi:hypothetical protein
MASRLAGLGKLVEGILSAGVLSLIGVGAAADWAGIPPDHFRQFTVSQIVGRIADKVRFEVQVQAHSSTQAAERPVGDVVLAAVFAKARADHEAEARYFVAQENSDIATWRAYLAAPNCCTAVSASDAEQHIQMDEQNIVEETNNPNHFGDYAYSFDSIQNNGGVIVAYLTIRQYQDDTRQILKIRVQHISGRWVVVDEEPNPDFYK